MRIIFFGKLVTTNLTPNLFKPALGLAVLAALASACGSSSPSTPGTGGSTAGTAGATGTAGNGSGGSSTAGNSGGGTTGTAGSSGGSAAGNTGSGGSGTAGSTGGSVGAGGNSTGGSSAGTGGATGGNVGTGGTATGGSAQGGRGGSAGGTGGSSAGAGGRGGSGTGGGTAGSGGNTGTGGTTAGCPANATFCSGFETSDMPAGAVYMANAAPGSWTRDFEVDTAQHHSGVSSLRVKSNGESGATGAYQMLAVPSTPSAFWVRFWIQSSAVIGMANHNAYTAASVGSGTNDTMIEFAEDTGIAFNTKDADCFPTVGCTGQHPTTYYMLPAMTWECIEISFDGANRHQQLYINGSMVIDAPSYPSAAMSLPFFKFGFDAYHGPQRQIWYDDVAVAPTRIGGCN